MVENGEMETTETTPEKQRETMTDKWGVWELGENGLIWDLKEPSQEYLDRDTNPLPTEPPEPTIEEYMMELDYRMSLIELGL